MNPVILYAAEAVVSSLLAFLICFFGTRFLISYLPKKKMTVMDYHKEGKPSIPRPGGPAIIGGIVAGEVFLFADTGSLAILALILVTLISGVIGIVDDLKTLGGVTKPALLLLGGVPILTLQYLIPNARVFDHHLALPLFSVPTNIPLIYPFLVMLAIPVTTNTVNTIDVLNGVVSGFVLIACVPITAAIALKVWIGKDDPAIFLAILPILASVVGFYYFHRYPSKIFPGDSGAIALGGAYATMAIIGGVEVVAVIALLPAIMNSFFFLSSVKKLVEHRQIKSAPTIMFPDTRMVASNSPDAPVTLMRLLVAQNPLTEKQIGNEILKLALFCALLAVLTMMVTWVFTIGR